MLRCCRFSPHHTGVPTPPYRKTAGAAAMAQPRGRRGGRIRAIRPVCEATQADGAVGGLVHGVIPPRHAKTPGAAAISRSRGRCGRLCVRGFLRIVPRNRFYRQKWQWNWASTASTTVATHRASAPLRPPQHSAVTSISIALVGVGDRVDRDFAR